MLTQPQVQRYSAESGLRDIMIAEKEVVLTFLLQLLSERGILDRLGFKGGTCQLFRNVRSSPLEMSCSRDGPDQNERTGSQADRGVK
jgi:predicted nucleotidyltransferase component of viral defense system